MGKDEFASSNLASNSRRVLSFDCFRWKPGTFPFFCLFAGGISNNSLRVVNEVAHLVKKILSEGRCVRINLPKTSGSIRSMFVRPEGHTKPIIAMTANAIADSSLDAGMNSHLAKPIIMDEVIKVIARNPAR